MLPALRQDDLELTRSNITELENSDQVTRFFAQLGYDVDVAATLSHESLGLDAEDVKLRIGAIKKIAADRDGEIEVILFEVRSVTVDLIQAITRRFRQRAGQYLLVLTKDYEGLSRCGCSNVSRLLKRIRIISGTSCDRPTVWLNGLNQISTTARCSLITTSSIG